MDANMTHFLTFLGASGVQYIIPVYQRRYAWDEEDCRVLWEDIIRAGKNDRDHFVGSVLHIPEGGETITGMKKHLLIDGQQRLTTLSLLLVAFVEYLEADESRASFLTDIKVSSLRKNYLFNDDDYNGMARFKLVLSQEDKEALFSIVGNTPLPEGSPEGLTANLNFFRDRMRGKAFDAKTLWAGLNHIRIIDTQLTPGVDDAQLIFESMNSKGRPLTPTDLIRNYVLMSLPEVEQTRLYEAYWKPLESHFKNCDSPDREFNVFIWYWLWLMVPERKPKEDDSYDEFKCFKQDVFGGTAEELLETLLGHAGRYAKMFLGKEGDKELKKAFGNLLALDVRQIRPLFMALYECYESGKISKDDFVDLCHVFESFLFRRTVCGRLTTGLNHFFAGVGRDLSKKGDVATYVKAMLLTHGYNMTAYFPTDEHFKEQLVSRDCYNRFTKRGYLLQRLENAYHPKQPVEVGPELQIEHILPQSIEGSKSWQDMLGDGWQEIHETHCNNLGNLTLTGYNPELSNKSFGDKLNEAEYGFIASPYRLNDYVKAQKVWGAKQIEERAGLLAEKAVKIWAYPNVDPAVVEELKPKKGKAQATEWTIEEHHHWLAEGGPCRSLYLVLTSAIEDAHPNWEMYVTKHYVGYRTGKRKLRLAFIPRVGGGGRIALCLPKSVDDFHDPMSLCTDKRPTGGIGPGCATFVNFGAVSEIGDVMELINQC